MLLEKEGKISASLRYGIRKTGQLVRYDEDHSKFSEIKDNS